MKVKEDYKYYLDVGKVKVCIKICNDNPNLRRRESINVTTDRKRCGRTRKKDGKIK